MMNDYITPADRLRYSRINSAGKFWVGYAILLALVIFAIPTCYAAGELYRAVMCPPDWRIIIAQRYDDRDRFDWIIKRTWVAHCY